MFCFSDGDRNVIHTAFVIYGQPPVDDVETTTSVETEKYAHPIRGEWQGAQPMRRFCVALGQSRDLESLLLSLL